VKSASRQLRSRPSMSVESDGEESLFLRSLSTRIPESNSSSPALIDALDLGDPALNWASPASGPWASHELGDRDSYVWVVDSGGPPVKWHDKFSSWNRIKHTLSTMRSTLKPIRNSRKFIAVSSPPPMPIITRTIESLVSTPPSQLPVIPPLIPYTPTPLDWTPVKSIIHMDRYHRLSPIWDNQVSFHPPHPSKKNTLPLEPATSPRRQTRKFRERSRHRAGAYDTYTSRPSFAPSVTPTMPPETPARNMQHQVSRERFLNARTMDIVTRLTTQSAAELHVHQTQLQGIRKASYSQKWMDADVSTKNEAVVRFHDFFSVELLLTVIRCSLHKNVFRKW